MRWLRSISAVLIILAMASGHLVFAQSQQGNPQPLNASVSDFGTSFTFGASPICKGCIEGEFGFMSLDDGRFMPAVLTFAPLKSATDVSVFVNALESFASDGRRVTHFGSRFDFVIRQKLLDKNGFVLALAPHGTVFCRDGDGGRFGGSFAAQYAKGNNGAVANFTFTKAVGASSSNPVNDFQSAFDYSRTLSSKGLSVFVGFFHEATTGSPQTLSTEQGIVLPFRNGQVEFAIQQMNLNVQPTLAFQARVVMNWGKILGKK